MISAQSRRRETGGGFFHSQSRRGRNTRPRNRRKVVPKFDIWL
jgi:hypothetical protein